MQQASSCERYCSWMRSTKQENAHRHNDSVTTSACCLQHNGSLHTDSPRRGRVTQSMTARRRSMVKASTRCKDCGGHGTRFRPMQLMLVRVAGESSRQQQRTDDRHRRWFNQRNIWPGRVFQSWRAEGLSTSRRAAAPRAAPVYRKATNADHNASLTSQVENFRCRERHSESAAASVHVGGWT
jgi:hypothetical protein